MKGARRTKNIILGIIGILIAAYVLFPFYLVVMNSFKAQTSIVESPVSLAGASVAQLWENLTKVASNSNFNFWYAFGTSALITVISLVLLAVFGGMAAWVISRNNKKKWPWTWNVDSQQYHNNVKWRNKSNQQPSRFLH